MSYKPLEITVDTPDDFQEMIANKDFKICKSIVEGVLANIDTITREVKQKLLSDQSVISDINGGTFGP